MSWIRCVELGLKLNSVDLWADSFAPPSYSVVLSYLSGFDFAYTAEILHVGAHNAQPYSTPNPHIWPRE